MRCANGPTPTGSRRVTRSPSRTRRTAQRGDRPCSSEKSRSGGKEATMQKTWLFRIFMVAAAIGAAMTPASAQKTLKVVQHSDIKVIDPIWSAAYIARNHGYLIYDTLFALDAKLQPRPQMAESLTMSDDGLTATIRLRD